LILATGYNHRNQHHILDELSPYLIKTPSGDYSLNRNYSIESDQNFLPKIFLQGICETTHGFSDTLLSILPIRAYQVVDELANSNGFSDHSHYKTNGHVPSEGEVIYR
jgi:L-ornithine N5-oxygenase